MVSATFFIPKSFQSLPGRPAGFYIPAFQFIEVGFEQLYTFSVQIEIVLIFEAPLAVLVYRLSAHAQVEGGARHKHEWGELFFVAVPSRHHPYRPLHVPDFSSGLDGIGKSFFAAGDDLIVAILYFRAGPAEIGQHHVADGHGLVVESGEASSPGQHFGFVFRVDAGFPGFLSFPAIAEHQGVVRKRNHLGRYLLDQLFGGCPSSSAS